MVRITQNGYVNRLRKLGAPTLALALLAACASPSPPKPNAAVVKQFAGQGYITDDRYGVATTSAAWDGTNGRFDLALTVPTKGGPFPLVIYLPALGESSSAGAAWRTAWAEGGYAVVSIQLLAEDTGAFSSAQARTGDFSALYRERYSAKVMTARIGALRAALAELSRRHDRKEAPLDRIDLSRIAVAGYDLGAYTAMVIAGESIRDIASLSLQIPISAVIALSPYSDFSGAAFAERYGGIRGPVLSVTGDNDVDSVGLVKSPSVRKAPFEFMPGGDKYLLALSDIQHRTLAGGEIQQETDENRPPEKAARSGGNPQDGGRSGGRRRGGGSAGGSSADGQRGSERSAARGGVEYSLTAHAISVSLIQGVTNAFLDAYLKNDPIAREWLEKDARRWIKDRGEIRRK